MRTSEAITDAPGVWNVFYATLGIYAVLGVATIFVLRLLANVPLTEPAKKSVTKETKHGT